MSRRFTLCIVVICLLLIGGGYVLLPERGTVASETKTSLQVAVYVSDDDSASTGESCGFGGISGGASFSTYRQLVVMNESWDVIGTANLSRGTIEDGQWGKLCAAEATLDLPSSGFYTLSIREDGFKYTVSSEELDSVDWSLQIQTDL